jgi:flagellar biosynthesis regulator FlaF
MAKKHSSPAKFNPRCLVDAAVQIDQARKAGNKGRLSAAIDHNRVMWTGIHSHCVHADCPFPKEKCGELIRLSDYVWSATKAKGADISDMVLDSLINIDLKISEDLLYKDNH